MGFELVPASNPNQGTVAAHVVSRVQRETGVRGGEVRESGQIAQQEPARASKQIDNVYPSSPKHGICRNCHALNHVISEIITLSVLARLKKILASPCQRDVTSVNRQMENIRTLRPRVRTDVQDFSMDPTSLASCLIRSPYIPIVLPQSPCRG